MRLAGDWRAIEADEGLRRLFPNPEYNDDSWEPVPVPGHWRSACAFADSDGPLLYRRRFEAEPAGADQRVWLDVGGLFYQGDVWLDGSYLGDTEGYYVPHSFEITDQALARREHLVAFEVACPPESGDSRNNLTGVFQDWGGIDPGWNPGGVWAPVDVTTTGPVRIQRLSVNCRDATEERATLRVAAVLDAREPTAVTLDSVVFPAGRDDEPVTKESPVAKESKEYTLAAGPNTVRWHVQVPRPELWWPRALGDQPLHDIEVTVTPCRDGAGAGLPAGPAGPASSPLSAARAGGVSDRVRRRTGLRQVRMDKFVVTVNGERLFAKGASLGPTRPDLMDVPPAAVEADLQSAVSANLDLVRVYGHISRPELYDAADRLGLMVWQDLPLVGRFGGSRKSAMAQARAAVEVIGHHPSVAVWCGHDEPAGEARRLPTWSRTRLDSAVRRTIDRTDGSRPVVAHSGMPPHPAGGTDTHEYQGWQRGELSDLPKHLSRWPVLARWIGEFGAPAVPNTDDWLEPDSWPDLDWEALVARHGFDREGFERMLPPREFPTFARWKAATQDYQGEVIRLHVETLRRLKYRPSGGFSQFLLADSQPSIGFSVLDHERKAKRGYLALKTACSPVLPIADYPEGLYLAGDRLRLALHVVNDLRVPLADAEMTASLSWPGGGRTWRFGGEVAADSCTRVGKLQATLPEKLHAGELLLELLLTYSPAPRSEPHHSDAGEDSGSGASGSDGKPGAGATPPLRVVNSYRTRVVPAP